MGRWRYSACQHWGNVAYNYYFRIWIIDPMLDHKFCLAAMGLLAFIFCWERSHFLKYVCLLILMNIGSGLSCRSRKQSFISSVYFFVENDWTGTYMPVQLCWTVLVQDWLHLWLKNFAALHHTFDFTDLHYTFCRGLNKISGIHVLSGSVIWFASVSPEWPLLYYTFWH